MADGLYLPDEENIKCAEPRRRRRQRVLWIMLAVLGAAAIYRYATWISWTDKPLRVKEQIEKESGLSNKVNVNVAGWASLARLPGIGPVRARAIVAYRDKAGVHREGAVFTRAEDLMRVKGIGPATIEQIKDYLNFDMP